MLLKLELGDLRNDILGHSELVRAERSLSCIEWVIKSKSLAVCVISPKQNKKVTVSCKPRSTVQKPARLRSYTL